MRREQIAVCTNTEPTLFAGTMGNRTAGPILPGRRREP
jgi:hypothetical protein